MSIFIFHSCWLQYAAAHFLSVWCKYLLWWLNMNIKQWVKQQTEKFSLSGKKNWNCNLEMEADISVVCINVLLSNVFSLEKVVLPLVGLIRCDRVREEEEERNQFLVTVKMFDKKFLPRVVLCPLNIALIPSLWESSVHDSVSVKN